MRLLSFLAAAFALASCSDSNSTPGTRSTESPAPTTVSFAGAGSKASGLRLARGERLADVLGCKGCHGADLTGEDWSEPGFGRLWTANLTRSVPRYSDAELLRVIESGTRPDRELWEMPSHLFTQLSPVDAADLVLFLRSKAPTGVEHPAPVFEQGARDEIAAGTFKSSRAHVAVEGSAWPPDAGQGHALGRYIVRATCAECHGMQLRGGEPNPAATPRPDLRMVAGYDLPQFTTLLRTGKAAGDREVSLMSEVARGRYSHLTDEEIAAVHAYLQKVAEVAP